MVQCGGGTLIFQGSLELFLEEFQLFVLVFKGVVGLGVVCRST